MSKRRKPKRTWQEWLGVGGLSVLLCVAGYTAYLFTIWRYRLVLRDETLLLNLPAPFVGGGILLVALCLWTFKQMAVAQGQRIGWGIREGRARGGPLQWEDVLLCTIPGALGLCIGLGLFLNCFGDTGPVRTYHTVVIGKYIYRGKRDRFQLQLADWKRPGNDIYVDIGESLYEAFDESQKITIKTKAGGLGYEWIVEIGNTGRAA